MINININTTAKLDKAENFIINEWHFKEMVGEMINEEINGIMIIRTYENKEMNANIKLYWNTENDYLRIDWDENGWRNEKYYNGEW